MNPVKVTAHLNWALPIVSVTLSQFCQRDPEYTLVVSFGTQISLWCAIRYSYTVWDIRPGENFFTRAQENIPLRRPYCLEIFVDSTSGFVQRKYNTCSYNIIHMYVNITKIKVYSGAII